MKRFIVCLTVLLLIAACSTALAAKGNESKPVGNLGNPGVIPPQSKAHGMTYGEWGAKFWQWCYSMPVDDHPLFQSGDVDLSVGQSGTVWFLGGTIAPTELGVGEYGFIGERSGTIPTGKALFFPILNAEAATLEGNGDTPVVLTAVVEEVLTSVDPSSLFCKIDGVSVANLDSYRRLSPPKIYGPLPQENVLAYWGYEAPAGATSLFVADGWYVMLPPLPVGTHTISFGGIADSTSTGGILFKLDVTYNITVVPGQK